MWGVAREPDPLFAELGVSTRPAERGKGVSVINVEKKSVAERAGLAVGDMIVSMDGTAVEDRETLNRLVAEKKWGDSARLALRRGGNAVNVTAYFRREPVQDESPPPPEPKKP
ncbi:MAG TPA: PDZ domain-containing protein [Thermoanaerobaculia bacterium]|nr:PDZ domain-containing protein [Thermoanaerobaculia bacterium]